MSRDSPPPNNDLTINDNRSLQKESEEWAKIEYDPNAVERI